MNSRTLLAAALLLAACGGPRTQTAPQPAGTGRNNDTLLRDSLQRELFTAYRAAQMPSVFALIGARERLKLTSLQVTSLDSIADAVRLANRPFTDSLRSLTNSGSGGPLRMPRGEFQTPRAVRHLRQIGENNRAGLAAIQALLTAEQRAEVCKLAAEERAERFGGMQRRGGMGGGGGGRDGGRGGYGQRRMPGMMPDSAGGRMGGAGGWPWCGPSRAPRSAPRDSAAARP